MKYFKLHLIRHGLTAANLEGRYIGSGTDLSLCEEGRTGLLELKREFEYPQVGLVFTSPLLRAKETAEILYPGVRTIALQDLREMGFGVFENRLLTELAQDPDFAAWIDPTSEKVPEGAESRQAFADRSGGMLMKLFEFMIKMLARHALPQRRPEEWMTDPGCGYSLRLDTAMWMRDHLAEAYDVVPRGYLD